LFLDLASHALDVLDFIFGPLQNVSGEAVNAAAALDVEDRVLMSFTTQTGASGTGYWNFSSGAAEDSLTVDGSAGQLRLSVFGDAPIELQTPRGAEAFSLPNPSPIQQPLIQAVVNELLGEGSSPSTGSSGARTSEVMDRVLAGYYGTREDGFWQHPERWPGRRR
jgi:predicted dehydrogenase